MSSKVWVPAHMADQYGRWYWVTDGVRVWPAMRDENASGGWTNGDTWEDFDSKVVCASLIDDAPPIDTDGSDGARTNMAESGGAS